MSDHEYLSTGCLPLDHWPALPEGVTGQQIRERTLFTAGGRTGRVGNTCPKVITREDGATVAYREWDRNGHDRGEKTLPRYDFDRRFERRLPDDAGHEYLSTGCLHGEHDYCSGKDGQAGPKTPAQCKFCATPCVCPCHQETAEGDETTHLLYALRDALNALEKAGHNPIPRDDGVDSWWISAHPAGTIRWDGDNETWIVTR